MYKNKLENGRENGKANAGIVIHITIAHPSPRVPRPLCFYNKKYQLASTDQTPGGVQLELNSSDQNKKDTFQYCINKKKQAISVLTLCAIKELRFKFDLKQFSNDRCKIMAYVKNIYVQPITTRRKTKFFNMKRN